MHAGIKVNPLVKGAIGRIIGGIPSVPILHCNNNHWWYPNCWFQSGDFQICPLVYDKYPCEIRKQNISQKFSSYLPWHKLYPGCQLTAYSIGW